MNIIDAQYDAYFRKTSNSFKADSYEKRLKDYASYYLNAEGVNPETVMYEVSSDPWNTNKPGGLLTGLTTLMPVAVNGECAFTKGHFHQDLNCEEIYECMEGEGLLMLMDEDGKTCCEKVTPFSVHHIHGNLAHRLINTGDVPLKVFAVWPIQSGHDYDRILKMPFAYRVFKVNGKIEIRDHE